MIATPIQKAACESMGTKQCAPICLSHLSSSGVCPEAHRVWPWRTIVAEKKRRPNGPLNVFSTDLVCGMFVVHEKTGYLGMIVEMTNLNASMQAVNNGPRKRARLVSLRPATRKEIVDTGLGGVGCVEPPE